MRNSYGFNSLLNSLFGFNRILFARNKTVKTIYHRKRKQIDAESKDIFSFFSFFF